MMGLRRPASRGKDDPLAEIQPTIGRVPPWLPLAAQSPRSTKSRQLPLCPFRLPFLSRPHSVSPPSIVNRQSAGLSIDQLARLAWLLQASRATTIPVFPASASRTTHNDTTSSSPQLHPRRLVFLRTGSDPFFLKSTVCGVTNQSFVLGTCPFFFHR